MGGWLWGQVLGWAGVDVMVEARGWLRGRAQLTLPAW